MANVRASLNWLISYESLKKGRLGICMNICLWIWQKFIPGLFQVSWCVISWQSVDGLWPAAASSVLLSSRLLSVPVFLLHWSELEPVIFHWAHLFITGSLEMRWYHKKSKSLRHPFFIFPQNTFCSRTAALINVLKIAVGINYWGFFSDAV